MTEPIRTAVIQGGKVVNVVVLAKGSKWRAPKGQKTIPHETANIGWSFVDGKLIEPAVAQAVDNRTIQQKRAAAYPKNGDQLDADYKNRQKARLLTAKAAAALKEGDIEAALSLLIDAVVPCEESDQIDILIEDVKQSHPKE